MKLGSELGLSAVSRLQPQDVEIVVASLGEHIKIRIHCICRTLGE